MDMKKRLNKLELILDRKSAGSHDDYLKAKKQEADRVRKHIEGILQAISDNEPWPEIKPVSETDVETIKRYEKVHPIPAEPDVRERLLKKLDIIKKRANSGA